MSISFETPKFTNLFESVSKKLESKEKEPQEKKLENELKITEDHFEKLRICNLILEINQDSIEARFAQIRSYLELDHPEKAFEIASDILSKIKKFPGTKNNSELNIVFNIVCAGIKKIEKKYEESLIFLDEGLRFDENYLTLLTAKGKCLFHLKKYTEAIEYYKKALDVDPEDVESNFKLGETLRMVDKNYEAIEYYKKALDVDPDNLEIMEGIAHAYEETEEKQIAIDYYDKILKIEPNNMDIQTYRIVCLDKFKENSELLSIINEKLKIDENNQDLLINKAIILSNMKKFKEAEECFDKILINNDLGILVDIRKHFEKATEVDENNKLAKDNLVK